MKSGEPSTWLASPSQSSVTARPVMSEKEFEQLVEDHPLSLAFSHFAVGRHPALIY